jgi:hypothetical protein
VAVVFRADHERNDEVSEGLRHTGIALTGLGKCAGVADLGLRSSDSLQPRLSQGGLSALAHWRALSPTRNRKGLSPSRMRNCGGTHYPAQATCATTAGEAGGPSEKS